MKCTQNMEFNKRNAQPAAEPENDSHYDEPAAERQRPAPARRNPRLVIGSLDYFEMLMEQDEL